MSLYLNRKIKDVIILEDQRVDNGYYVGVFNNGINEYSVKLKLKQEK